MRANLRGRWWLAVGATAAIFSGVALSSPPTSAASSAPGVSSNQVTVGAIVSQSGALASDFAPLLAGERAYFDMINAQGGVNGRKINLQYALDDSANPTQDNTLAHTLVFQDNVFAVTGVGTAFFSPQVFALTHTPTYGYAVSDNWSGPNNLFAAYGSVLDNTTAEPEYAYIAQQLHAKKVGVLAYSISESADACNKGVTGYQKYGLTVAYQDTNINYFDINLSSDIQRMKAAGVDFVLSCMDVTGNVDLARGLQQYGMGNTNEVWLNGQDQSVLNQYSSLMQHVYFLLEHAPFSALSNPKYKSFYPALQTYVSAMNKYEPADTYQEVALEGWLSAQLFTDGLKKAGRNPTQQAVINADNAETFTGNGLITAVNWKYSHTKATGPFCAAYVKVVGTKLVTIFATGHRVFTCFGYHPAHDTPITPSTGVPGD